MFAAGATLTGLASLALSTLDALSVSTTTLLATTIGSATALVNQIYARVVNATTIFATTIGSDFVPVTSAYVYTLYGTFLGVPSFPLYGIYSYGMTLYPDAYLAPAVIAPANTLQMSLGTTAKRCLDVFSQNCTVTALYNAVPGVGTIGLSMTPFYSLFVTTGTIATVNSTAVYLRTLFFTSGSANTSMTGIARGTFSTGASSGVYVSFGVTLPSIPTVVTTVVYGGTGYATGNAFVLGASTTGFYYNFQFSGSFPSAQYVSVNWIAIC